MNMNMNTNTSKLSPPRLAIGLALSLAIAISVFLSGPTSLVAAGDTFHSDRSLQVAPPEADQCVVDGDYSDGVCDAGCPLPDPDCADSAARTVVATRATGDVCETQGWYRDDVCDLLCQRPDPACDGAVR